MTAVQLLIPLAALMLTDLLLTLVGLRRGLSESNPTALRFMARLGSVRGAATFAAMWFVGLSVFALLFPAQWALILLGCITSGCAVANNIRWLRRTA